MRRLQAAPHTLYLLASAGNESTAQGPRARGKQPPALLSRQSALALACGIGAALLACAGHQNTCEGWRARACRWAKWDVQKACKRILALDKWCKAAFHEEDPRQWKLSDFQSFYDTGINRWV